MIELVYLSLLAALLPIVLHVCVRILSLVYWSLLAPVLSIVLHARDTCVQWPTERKQKMDRKTKKTAEDVVRTFLDAYNKNDLDGVMACLADDFVRRGESTKWAPMSKKSYKDMWARFAVAFPDFKWNPNCMVVSGDTVAIEVTETATFTEPWTWQGKTLRPTGEGYRARIGVFFRVNKDGLIQDIEEEGTSILNSALQRAGEQSQVLFRPEFSVMRTARLGTGRKSGHDRYFSE
jgi:ketosteroid isomerase-like protein